MEIPRLDFLICNRGAAVVASATDWRPRVYENQRESHSARSVRLWEVAVPKMKINHEETKGTKVFLFFFVPFVSS
jgi:hypothetical protein